MTDLFRKNPVALVLAAVVVGVVLYLLIQMLWPLLKLALLIIGLVTITTWLYKTLTSDG